MSQHQVEEEEPVTEEAAAGNDKRQAPGLSDQGEKSTQAFLQDLQAAVPPEALPEARLVTLLEMNRAALAVPFITPPCIPPAVCLVEKFTEATDLDSRRSIISCNSTSSSDIKTLPLPLGGALGPVAAVGPSDRQNIGFFTRLTSKVVKSLNRTLSGSPKQEPPSPVAHQDISSFSRPSRDRSSQHGPLSRAPSAVDLSPAHSAPSRTVSRRSSFISGPAAGPSPSGRGPRRSSVSNFTAAESHDCVTIFFSDLCGFST